MVPLPNRPPVGDGVELYRLYLRGRIEEEARLAHAEA